VLTHIKGRTQSEGVGELRAEGDIWTCEGGVKRELEKTAQ